MSLEVGTASKFIVNELSIVTKSGKLDISGLYEELNIFDSILLPVISGSILISDSIGLSAKLIFDGSESILIDLSKSQGSNVLNYKKAFRVYKQSDRENVNQNSEKYILHFVSDEMMFSDQQLVNQAYKTTYSDIVKKILSVYLKTPSNKLNGIIETSTGIRDVVIPNLRPLDAIDWCAKRAIDEKRSANFLFFENNLGYNFVTLSTLLSQPELFKIKFSAKNLESTNAIDDLFRADIGGQYQFDLMNVYNIMQRDNGQLVIVDPFAGWDDDEVLDEGKVKLSTDPKLIISLSFVLYLIKDCNKRKSFRCKSISIIITLFASLNGKSKHGNILTNVPNKSK